MCLQEKGQRKNKAATKSPFNSVAAVSSCSNKLGLESKAQGGLLRDGFSKQKPVTLGCFSHVYTVGLSLVCKHAVDYKNDSWARGQMSIIPAFRRQKDPEFRLAWAIE